MSLKEEAKRKIETLETIRKREGKSVPEFAKEVGTTKQTYWNWINGKTVPNLHSLDKIEEFLEN